MFIKVLLIFVILIPVIFVYAFFMSKKNKNKTKENCDDESPSNCATCPSGNCPMKK